MFEEYANGQGGVEKYGQLSDEELIDLFRLNNKDFYFELVLCRHYQPLLLFIKKNYCHNMVTAEDVVQETYLKTYLALASFDSTRRFKPWLYKIAINTSLTYLKDPADINLDDCFELSILADSPETYVDKKLQQEKLQSAIKSLGPDCKEIVDLFYNEDSNCEEVGHKLGVRAVVVRFRLQEVRKNLLTSFEL
jgi:RNA polymerase sigma-70 factor, ECF subfamily